MINNFNFEINLFNILNKIKKKCIIIEKTEF